MNREVQDRIKTHVVAYILSKEANNIEHDEDWNHFVDVMTLGANYVVEKLCEDKLIQKRTLYMFRGDKQHGRELINRLTKLGYENKNNHSGENENIIYFGTCGVVSVCDVGSECHKELVKHGFKLLRLQHCTG